MGQLKAPYIQAIFSNLPPIFSNFGNITCYQTLLTIDYGGLNLTIETNNFHKK